MASAEHHRKLSHFFDRDHRDGASGMSASTKRHFDHVKRKMLAFVDRQHRHKRDANLQLPPPLPFHHNPPPIFVDQNRSPHPRSHHPTPLQVQKQLPHFQGHQPAHRPIPHHAFATPQEARRAGTPIFHRDRKFSAHGAFF